MPKYTVNYFEAKWLAEPIRLILSYGGLDFEDKRFKREDWPSIKPNSPCGQAPFLQIEGGKTLGQSKAICRYLAKQTDLMPKCDWEAAQCDMVVDYVDDFRSPVGPIYFESNEELKKEKLAKYLEDVPKFLNNFEKFLKENGSKGLFVGNKLTWADIYVYHVITLVKSAVEKMGGTLSCDPYPEIRMLVSKVVAIPNIAAWIEKRPKTDA